MKLTPEPYDCKQNIATCDDVTINKMTQICILNFYQICNSTETRLRQNTMEIFCFYYLLIFLEQKGNTETFSSAF